jgi:hypothetical protein
MSLELPKTSEKANDPEDNPDPKSIIDVGLKFGYLN